MRTPVIAVSIIALLVGCSVAPIEGSGPEKTNPGSTTPASACIAPSPIGDRDPASFPKCACAAGGAARCIPKEGLGGLSSHLDTCDGEKGACVPDALLREGAAPAKCESIVGEGRCVSLCIPEVAKQEKLLDRGKGNVCAPDERCAPCLNPLENNAPTGLCEIGGSSCPDAKDGGTSSLPTTEIACPYAGPPIDVSKYEACADGMRCVPISDKMPAAVVAMLARCKNPNEVCAPEKSIAALGQYRPVTCASVGGAEGRCMNASLPPLAAQKDRLPGAGCAANERCAPCFDPLSGKPTGVCSTVRCDAPQKPAFTFKQCCSTKGRCVPESILPASARDELGRDDGTCTKGDLCVPNEMIDPATKPTSCSATIPFVGSYTGVCVSDCLESLVPSGNCSGGRVCLPCNDPFDGTPTGAPGCTK